MKAIEQYFHVVLFISMLYKVVLTLESVDKRNPSVFKAFGQLFYVVHVTWLLIF